MIGNLRDRVTFQKKSTSKDSSGQDVHTWVNFSPSIVRSASIKPLKGQESVQADAVFSQTLISIMVRYDPEVATIGAEHRIIEHEKSPNKVYAIKAPPMNHNNRNQWIEFTCSEGLQDRF